VCVRVCGISILLLFLHTSCELFYAERKERQMKTTSDLFSCYSSLVLSPFHSCCSAIPRRYLTSMLDGPATSTTLSKMTNLRLPIHVPVTQTTRNFRIHLSELPNHPSHHHHCHHCHHCHHHRHHHQSPKPHFKVETNLPVKKIYRLPIIITL